jgi:hypothetical protein
MKGAKGDDKVTPGPKKVLIFSVTAVLPLVNSGEMQITCSSFR